MNTNQFPRYLGILIECLWKCGTHYSFSSNIVRIELKRFFPDIVLISWKKGETINTLASSRMEYQISALLFCNFQMGTPLKKTMPKIIELLLCSPLQPIVEFSNYHWKHSSDGMSPPSLMDGNHSVFFGRWIKPTWDMGLTSRTLLTGILVPMFSITLRSALWLILMGILTLYPGYSSLPWRDWAFPLIPDGRSLLHPGQACERSVTSFFAHWRSS